MSSRRRDDRPHDDRYKLWTPQDKPADRDNDRRRHRSATVPSQNHDSRPHPTQPPDTRRSSRAYKQETHYTTTAPSTSHQPTPGPSSSRAQNPPRSSAQNPFTGYHLAPPYQNSTPILPSQVPHTSKGYSGAPSSSRRAQPDNIDSRSYSNRRGQTAPTSFDHVPSGEDVGKSSRQPYPSRAVQPSTQPMVNATTSNWTSSAQDAHAKRSKDRDKERDRYREPGKEREKERTGAEHDRDRYREKYRSEAHREKDRGVENDRHREPSRFRNEKRMESDSEGLVYPDNASKVSLSGREGYQPSIRESISGHRRQRTEDGPSSSTDRRPHTGPSHNPMYTHSTGSQAAVATGSSTPGVGSNPPPAPRVMPVYLPHKLKSHHERHASSGAHGGQSGSDADRASVKHRMERNHSGAAVQRGDGPTSSAVRDRQAQDGPAGPREDTRSRSEAKYSTQGAYHNSRQPLQPTSVNSVDIPLVTPGFNSSPLPHESRGHVGTIPVLVAGEGPPDRQAHDALSKPQTALRRDEVQDARYPHGSHTAVVKPSLGRTQSSEVTHNRSEVPPPDRSRTDPAVVDHSHDRHRRSDDPTPPQNISRYPQFTSTPMEQQSYQQRSANKTSFSNPPAVSGPRPQPPSSYADNQNESTRLATAATPAPGPISRVNSSQPPAPGPVARVASSQPQPSSSYADHHNESTRPAPAATPAPAPMTRAASNQPPTPGPIARVASSQPQPSSSYADHHNEPTRLAPATTPAPVPITRAASNQPPAPGPIARVASSQLQPSSYAEHHNESTRPVPAATPAPAPITRAASNQPPAPGPMTRVASSQPHPSSYADRHNESTRPAPAATPAPAPMTRAASNQPSAPPSPAYKIDSSPAKNGSPYGSLPSAQAVTYGSGTTSIKRSPSTPPSTPMNSSQMMNASQPYTHHAPNNASEPPSRAALDRPEPRVVAPRMTTAQISNSSTVKSSWVVQTAQADNLPKNGYPTREDKYSARNGSHQPVETPTLAHPQLREVLSQDQHYSTHATPTGQSRAGLTQGSPKRSSPHGTPKDAYATPRRTPDSSPYTKVKEAVAPEQSRPPPFPSPALGPPQIAVIGATPSSVNQELPHRSQYNSGLLTPSYPAPPRVSKTASGSREPLVQAQPQTVRTHPITPSVSYQQTPALPPQPQPVPPQAPPAPQPSQPSSPYGQPDSNAGGFSPPPLPVPPPRLPGVDIPEDFFPVKTSMSNSAGIKPAPTSTVFPWQTTQVPAPTPASATLASASASTPIPSTQPLMPNGHADSYKDKPWMGEGSGATPATPVYQKAAAPVPSVSRDAAVAALVEARAPPSPLAGATGLANGGPANGVNQSTLGSQHLPPSQGTLASVTGPTNGINQGTLDLQHPPSSQGASVGSHPSTDPAPQLKRPKVTIEEVPESPMFMNKWPSTPSQPYPQTQAQAQSSEVNGSPKATPPSRPKDVPAHTPPVRPMPTAAMPAQSYPPPAPSIQHQADAPAASRPPHSAPPMQTSFSSSYVDALHRSTFGAQPPRGYQRPTDAQPSAKPPVLTSASAAALQSMRSASQPNVPQSDPLDTASRGKQYSVTPSAMAATHHPQSLSTAETQAKPPSSRPLVSASVAAAQATRPAAQPSNIQSALLDAASRGRQYPPTSTTTAPAPQPQSFPTTETHTITQPSRPTTSASAAAAAQATRPVLQPLNTAQGAPLDVTSKGRSYAATVTATTGVSHPQSLPTVETHVQPHSSRPTVPPVTIPQGPTTRATPSASAAKNQVQDTPIPNDPARYRGIFSSASRYASAAMNPLYPATRHATPATSNQYSKPPVPAYSNSHHRTVSLPTPQPNANSRPPSPHKGSQPLVNSSATSTQPFPATSTSQADILSRSGKAPEPSWASRVAVSGHPSTPAPPRVHLPSSISRAFSNESEMILLTPSSIAPSMPKTPQMSFGSVSQATAPPMRQRQASTDSRESKKKPGGFLGLFRTKSGSSRPLESPVAASPVKTFIGVQKSSAAVAPPMQYSKSSSSTKESKEKIMVPAIASSSKVQTAPNPPISVPIQQPKAPKGKTKTGVPDPIAFPAPQPTRGHKQPSSSKPPPSSNVFSHFTFLTSKRKRTVSGASLDVCDGNTATNTAVGSPYVPQDQPLPPIPPIRDPMLATGEWRDRAEAEQQKRKKNRPRPGVTFDVGEDPPDPGTGRQKGARLVRRKSGRTTTPGSR